MVQIGQRQIDVKIISVRNKNLMGWQQLLLSRKRIVLKPLKHFQWIPLTIIRASMTLKTVQWPLGLGN